MVFLLDVFDKLPHSVSYLKKDSRTRGHEVKLVNDQCSLDIRKYSFSERTINE